MIPKKIHFIYGLSEDNGDKPFVFFHWAAIMSAKKLNPDYEIYYWYKTLPESKYFEPLKDQVILKQIDKVPTHIFGNELCCIPHQADILRMEILMEHGGIYLDIDTITVKPFDDLLNNKCVMGNEYIPGIIDGLCNCVVMAEPNSNFIKTWYNTYTSFRSKGQNPNLLDDYYVEHSVLMPRKLAKDMPNDITVMPMETFLYPDWRPESLVKLFNEVHTFDKAYVHHLWESKCYDSLIAINENTCHNIQSTYTNLVTKLLKEDYIQAFGTMNIEQIKPIIEYKSRKELIESLYKEILGREADHGGLDYYHNSNWSIEQIKNSLLNSDEYKHKAQFTRENLVKYLPSGICAEIGTHKGAFAKVILESNKPEKLYLIDLWQNFDCGYPDAAINGISQDVHDSLFNSVKDTFKNNENVEIIRDYSTKALDKFNDKYFDWVYVDADHSYNACKLDLESADRVVKDDGYICGHDYVTSPVPGFGVNEAVHDFVKSKGYILVLLTDEFNYKSYVISKNEESRHKLLNSINRDKYE